MKKILLSFALLLLFHPIFTQATSIDINSATLSQLDELTGIGPAYAQRIIDGRPYASVNDLDKIKGIGPATLQKIKDQGFACVSCKTEINETIQPTKELAPISPLSTISYPSGIFINEVLPNPAGADEANEWIELYNSNSIDVDLSGWQIQDTNGTPKTFTINPSTSSGQAKITANGFLVFKRPDTKIMLNNDVDGLNLLTPDKKIVDSINYPKAPLGQSYSKTSSSWAWSTTPTASAQNIVTGVKVLSKIKNSVNNDLSVDSLASVSKSLNTNQDTQKNNPWFLFYIVLLVTIILATIILFIKLRLGKEKA